MAIERKQRPGDPRRYQVEDEMERLAPRGDEVYESPLDPDPGTDPRNPRTNLDDWRPASELDASREVAELRDQLDPDGWSPDDAFQ